MPMDWFRIVCFYNLAIVHGIYINLSGLCDLILSKTTQRTPFQFHEMAFGDSPHQRFRSKKIFYIVSIVVDFETIEGFEPERMYN